MKLFQSTIIFVFLFVLQTSAQKKFYSKVIADAQKQTLVMLNEIAAAKKVATDSLVVSPRSIENGQLKLVRPKDWTSGFFPGQLWFLYEMTGKEIWKKEAASFTAKIENQQFDNTTHDLGFKIYCSAGAAYRLTGNAHYKAVIIQAATTLSKRYNSTTGTIKSWDHMQHRWKFPVIIDNMMNLELLFAATKLSGDSSFYKIAVSHANATLKNHFRADNSTYHVIDYDSTKAGNILNKNTHQGYADESAWARGQAWGLYGYALCFRETGDSIYLHQAEKIAKFILHHKNLPKDLIPYWDFNAAGIPNEPRDVSAAAIIASALYELSLYSNQKNNYRNIANKIIKNITSFYSAAPGGSKGFLLTHSTGNKPFNSEIDEPLSYADYYYLEALQRGKRINANQPIF